MTDLAEKYAEQGTLEPVTGSESDGFDHVAYANFVRDKKKSGEAIIAQMTPEKADLDHMVMGISGEAGELLDATKRWTIYNKPIDLPHVIEELGDLEFFLEGYRQRLGITREQTLAANLTKLGKRFHEGKYSDQQAQERADKA